jgi:hypothetical protein
MPRVELMKKILALLPTLFLSGITNAAWIQHIDYQTPNDSIEETPTQVDDNAQEYAPTDLPQASQDQQSQDQPNQDNQSQDNQDNGESDQDNPNEYYDDE